MVLSFFTESVPDGVDSLRSLSSLRLYIVAENIDTLMWHIHMEPFTKKLISDAGLQLTYVKPYESLILQDSRPSRMSKEGNIDIACDR
jgi:hypothetical protein